MPRLFDLVRVKDDQIRTAFFFALRNTLVADDLKQATDIAFQVISAPCRKRLDMLFAALMLTLKVYINLS